MLIGGVENGIEGVSGEVIFGWSTINSRGWFYRYALDSRFGTQSIPRALFLRQKPLGEDSYIVPKNSETTSLPFPDSEVRRNYDILRTSALPLFSAPPF